MKERFGSIDSELNMLRKNKLINLTSRWPKKYRLTILGSNAAYEFNKADEKNI